MILRKNCINFWTIQYLLKNSNNFYERDIWFVRNQRIRGRLASSVEFTLVSLIKTNDFYEDIKDDAEERYYTLNYDERTRRKPLLIGKTKKVIGLRKSRHVGKIITKFTAVRAKTYAYKAQKDSHEIRGLNIIKAKGVKKPISKGWTFEDFDKCVHDITNTPIYIYINITKE